MTPNRIIVADVLAGLAQLPDNSVHCCVTSPPYWGLRSYLPADHPAKPFEIGAEPTPDEYVAKLVAVFAEARRVLREDGVLWLNLGDSYNGSAGSGGKTQKQATNAGSFHGGQAKAVSGLKPKDLCMIPSRVAMALQADGWYLRSAVPWIKRSAMPESTRDRPNSSLEWVFMLTRSARYYFDMDAVRVAMQPGSAARYEYAFGGKKNETLKAADANSVVGKREATQGRHWRNADLMFECLDSPHGLCFVGDELVAIDCTTAGYKGAHYATFPPKFAATFIKAGTSQKGSCPECGAPWERDVVRKTSASMQNAGYTRDCTKRNDGGRPGSYLGGESTTLGWRPTCQCSCVPGCTIRHEPIPCTVLDPFMGSGTVAAVSTMLGRDWIGIDLDERNAALTRERLPMFAAERQGDNG